MSSFSTKEMESSPSIAHNRTSYCFNKMKNFFTVKSAPNKEGKVIFMHLVELFGNKEAPF